MKATLNCHHCDAPFPVPEDLTITTVQCEFCHAETALPEVLVATRHALYQERQAKEEQARARHSAQEDRTRQRRFTLKLILIIFVLPIFLVVGGILSVVLCSIKQVVDQVSTGITQPGTTTRHTVSSSSSITFSGPGDQSASFVCHAGQQTIRDRTFSAPDGVAVLVSSGCQLTLVNCQVKGRVGITANGGELIIRGGAVRSSGPAIIAMNNAQVTVEGDALLQGEATITANGAAVQVTLKQATVRASSTALVSTGGARIVRGQAKIFGNVLGTAE